jgi:S1-C subfamily serine protease
MSNLLLAQRLAYSTVKISCTSSKGKQATGTGFFYSTGRNEWLLITNKHLIEDSKSGQFTLTEGNKYNQPIPGSGIERKMDNFSEM